MKKINKDFIRNLRQNSTEAEKLLWLHLKAKRFSGYKFRRQHLINPYVVNFFCAQEKLIIELDGGQHVDQSEYDNERSIFLNKKGYRVLRFWNDVVFKEKENVLRVIYDSLTSSPQPSPPAKSARGEGVNIKISSSPTQKIPSPPRSGGEGQGEEVTNDAQ